MKYANVIYLENGSTYPTGETFDRMVVMQDAAFTTFGATWKVGNTTTEVTATEVDSLPAGFVAPGTIKNVVLTSGKVLLARDTF